MREYGPGHPLVFSHIPKTAGTSLRGALRQALQPTVMVEGVDACLFGGYDDYEDLKPAARATVYLAPEDLPADATVVAGHIGPHTTMTRYPGADHITILRAPQIRVISQFLHSRSVTELQLRHWGSAGEAFRAGWVPLRDYLQDKMIAPNTDNTITRFLAWPHPLLQKTAFIDESHDDQLFDAAVARLARFGHANVVENRDFMADLSAWLGRDLSDTRLNERTSVKPRLRPDLAKELAGDARDRLEHSVRIDVRVWHHVAAQVLPGEDLEAVLAGSVQRSLDRYREMLEEPDDTPPVRRAIERAYELGVKLDPRRRRAPR
jgi:hypothetical protein